MPRLGSNDSSPHRNGLQRTRSGNAGGLSGVGVGVAAGGAAGGAGGRPSNLMGGSSFYRHQIRNRFSRFKRWNWTTLSLVLVIAFVARNLLFRDYKSEQIAELQAAGLSQEEIERILPTDRDGNNLRGATATRTAAEIEHMKKDISMLFTEVKELRSIINGGSPRDGGAGSFHAGSSSGVRRRPGPSEGMNEAFRDMDRIHQEKRRIKEEAYLAAHPEKASSLSTGERGGQQQNRNGGSQNVEQRW